MKLNEKQKKALTIGGAAIVGVWALSRLARRKKGVPMPVDNGSPQAGYATYNVPYVYGATPGSGYTFGDINVGGPPVEAPPASTAVNCCDPCAAKANGVANFVYANFGMPSMQGANYTPPLVPYVSGFFQVN